jgi:hypothetical protein
MPAKKYVRKTANDEELKVVRIASLAKAREKRTELARLVKSIKYIRKTENVAELKAVRIASLVKAREKHTENAQQKKTAREVQKAENKRLKEEAKQFKKTLTSKQNAGIQKMMNAYDLPQLKPRS